MRAAFFAVIVAVFSLHGSDAQLPTIPPGGIVIPDPPSVPDIPSVPDPPVVPDDAFESLDDAVERALNEQPANLRCKLKDIVPKIKAWWTLIGVDFTVIAKVKLNCPPLVDCTLKARLGFVYVEASLVCPSKGAFPGTDSNGIAVKILLLK